MSTFLQAVSINIRQTDFSTFNVSLLALNQSRRTSRSYSIMFLSIIGFGCPRYRVVSSANWIHCMCVKWMFKSLQKIRKIKGPRQDPCGMP